MTHSHSPLIVSLAALVLAVAAGGCNDEPTHDLGYTAANLTGETPPALPPVAAYVTDFDGVWIGEAEDPLALLAGADDNPPAYRFPSGSTRIRLELAASGNSITFGEATPFPPATDPDVGYPANPDFGAAELGAGREATDRSIRPPFEGFPYHAGDYVASRDFGPTRPGFDAEDAYWDEGRLFDGKLDLIYSLNQVFASWCALQTVDSCPSTPGLSTNEATNQCFIGSGEDRTPMNCQKVALCHSAVCDCPEDGSACGVTGLNQSAHLTIRLSDDGVVGLFSGGVFVNERGFQQPLGTVHLRREQAAPAADAGTP
jgi:hypothetical protein